MDALALGLSRKQVPKLMEEALSQDLQDGLWFGDIKVSDLKMKGIYGGYSFCVAFAIDRAPSPKDPKIKKFSRISIDIGFEDALEKMPKKTNNAINFGIRRNCYLVR